MSPTTPKPRQGRHRPTDRAHHAPPAFVLRPSSFLISSVPGRANYVVLCNFDEFWIYDFDVQLDEPMDRRRVEEVLERYGPLAFPSPTEEKPVFKNNQEEVTRAANCVAEF